MGGQNQQGQGFNPMAFQPSQGGGGQNPYENMLMPLIGGYQGGRRNDIGGLLGNMQTQEYSLPQYTAGAGGPWGPWAPGGGYQNIPATPTGPPTESRPSHPPNGPPVTPGQNPASPPPATGGPGMYGYRIPTPPPIQVPVNQPAMPGGPGQTDIDRVMGGEGNITDLIRQTGNVYGRPSNPNGWYGNPNAQGFAPSQDQLQKMIGAGMPIDQLIRQVGRTLPGSGMGIQRPEQIQGPNMQPNFGMSNYGTIPSSPNFGGGGKSPNTGYMPMQRGGYWS